MGNSLLITQSKFSTELSKDNKALDEIFIFEIEQFTK